MSKFPIVWSEDAGRWVATPPEPDPGPVSNTANAKWLADAIGVIGRNDQIKLFANDVPRLLEIMEALQVAAREQMMAPFKPSPSAAEVEDAKRRINEYLASGGLFNPEAMEHDKVRDLILALDRILVQLPPVDGGKSIS